MVKYTWFDPMGFQVLTMSFSHGGLKFFLRDYNHYGHTTKAVMSSSRLQFGKVN